MVRNKVTMGRVDYGSPPIIFEINPKDDLKPGILAAVTSMVEQDVHSSVDNFLLDVVGTSLDDYCSFIQNGLIALSNSRSE